MKEIEGKLEKLLDVQKRHSHEPKKCPTCGQMMGTADSWILSDYQYIGGEIDSLKWVLGMTEHLTEDHT